MTYLRRVALMLTAPIGLAIFFAFAANVMLGLIVWPIYFIEHLGWGWGLAAGIAAWLVPSAFLLAFLEDNA